MYCTRNFKTKKALKDAVKLWNDYQERKPTTSLLTVGAVLNSRVSEPEPVTLYSPGIGEPKRDGKEFVEGPHYPAPHTWYAEVTVENGIVVKVK